MPDLAAEVGSGGAGARTCPEPDLEDGGRPEARSATPSNSCLSASTSPPLRIPLRSHTLKSCTQHPNTLLYHYSSLAQHSDMGRPLFSAPRQPVVRVEPEPQHPVVEKWTYWNAFDPDSDEFFENDDAVYEAFIDPADRIQLPADRTEPPAEPIDVSSSSEASSSGRGTPTDIVDGLDGEDLQAAMRTNFRNMEAARAQVMRVLDLPLPRNSALDAEINAGQGLPAEERVRYLLELLERRASGRERGQEQQRVETRPTRERVPTYLDWPPQEELRSPSPEPAPLVRVSVPSTPARPSTPPAQTAQATPSFATPSPPPSVTPRLYSWSSLSAPGPSVPASPLTNRGARMSVAHIATPSLIPVHRAA